MALDSDTSRVVEWEGERIGRERIGGDPHIIGGGVFISRRPRHLGMILRVIESLSDIKRELQSRLVRRPYR
jgi:hypothetical protein